MTVLCIDRTACVCVHLCRPTSLDAFVFGFVAPLYKASLPSSPLQRHLKQLDNITRFCDNILAVYFSSHLPCKSAAPTTGNTPTFSCTHLDNVIGVLSSSCLFHRTSALWISMLITCCSRLFSSGIQVPRNLSKKPRMPTSKN